jgi:hypothetical protein
VPAWVLSVTVRLAVTATPPDLNVTEMEQLLPAASELDELGQLLVCEKLPGLVPVKPMLLTTSGVVPVLLRVAVCDALLLPLLTVPKLKLAGPSVATE